ncbi:MAG TPA: hypothetical protein VFB08_18145 [Burkholderiales bacterium]|nr:hypothetical protein [Burkholderiales bacterium]
MKRLALAFALGLGWNSLVYPQSGDIAFWLPDPMNQSDIKRSQVIRGGEYITIKLQSAYAYYESGFFENIGNLVVASTVTFVDDARSIEGTAINKTLQKLHDDGDYIGIGDHLAVLSPSTPANIKIKVGFRGISGDQFKSLFDILGNSSLKTALNLAPTILGRVAALSSIAQQFLAPPYTSANPLQVLEMEQSFVLYPSGADIKGDGLREGFYVIVSGRHGKGDDLSKFGSLTTQDIRMTSLGYGLEYKDKSGNWQSLRKNSYAVISVTKTPVRGEDQTSPWFKKFADAETAAEDSTDGTADGKHARDLFREAGALLAADPNYIEKERISIKSQYLTALNEVLSKKSKQTANASDYDLPRDYQRIAKAYQTQLAAIASDVTIQLVDANRRPLPGAFLTYASLDTQTPKFESRQADKDGVVHLKFARPGIYGFQTDFSTMKASLYNSGEPVPALTVEPGKPAMVLLHAKQGSPWATLVKQPYEAPVLKAGVRND